MEKIYPVKIKGYPISIEVTSFTPALKCNSEFPEFQFPDEPMDFDWSAVTDNKLLNELIEDFLFEYVNNELRNILEKKCT